MGSLSAGPDLLLFHVLLVISFQEKYVSYGKKILFHWHLVAKDESLRVKSGDFFLSRIKMSLHLSFSDIFVSSVS